jgi:hypothetical protein
MIKMTFLMNLLLTITNYMTNILHESPPNFRMTNIPHYSHRNINMTNTPHDSHLNIIMTNIPHDSHPNINMTYMPHDCLTDYMHFLINLFLPVLRIRDILVRIRIVLFSSVTFKMPT